MRVPLNFSVRAHLRVYADDAAGPSGIMVTNPDETVSGPSSATTPLITFTSTTTGAAAEIWVRTSAAGQHVGAAAIAARGLKVEHALGLGEDVLGALVQAKVVPCDGEAAQVGCLQRVDLRPRQRTHSTSYSSDARTDM